MKKIVLAFDSFKGSLSSENLAEISHKAILEVFQECDIIKIPIADGEIGRAHV